MSVVVFETVAAVTERGQTTVPAAVRKRLAINKPGAIVWRIESNGKVTVDAKTVEEEPDPVLGGFLDFLSADMAAHPERLRPIEADLVNRINVLVGDVEIDLERPLPDDVD